MFPPRPHVKPIALDPGFFLLFIFTGERKVIHGRKGDFSESVAAMKINSEASAILLNNP